MDYGLPFPIEVVFLLLVLPIAFAYLISVAGVGMMFLRKLARKLFAGPPSRHDPPAA
jgi:hypothetical protein